MATSKKYEVKYEFVLSPDFQDKLSEVYNMLFDEIKNLAKNEKLRVVTILCKSDSRGFPQNQ